MVLTEPTKQPTDPTGRHIGREQLPQRTCVRGGATHAAGARRAAVDSGPLNQRNLSVDSPDTIRWMRL